MLMLESGVVIVAAAEASVVDVPIVDAGMIGGIVVATVGGVMVTIGAVSGGWEVDSPYLACNAFSNSCSVAISL